MSFDQIGVYGGTWTMTSQTPWLDIDETDKDAHTTVAIWQKTCEGAYSIMYTWNKVLVVSCNRSLVDLCHHGYSNNHVVKAQKNGGHTKKIVELLKQEMNCCVCVSNVLKVKVKAAIINILLAAVFSEKAPKNIFLSIFSN